MDENANRITNLKRLMKDQYGGKQSALAAKLARQADYISRLFTGRTRLSGDLAREFEKLLGVPKYSLDEDPAAFEVPSAADYELIPQLDLKASCGNGKFNDYVCVKGGLSFKRETLQAWGITPNNGRIIYADGQSMEPTIGHGRVVLINMDDTTLQDGRVYLICDADSAMLLKRLVREFDQSSGGMVWKMRSDNPDKRQYADKPLPDHSAATVVGRAVWHDGVL